MARWWQRLFGIEDVPSPQVAERAFAATLGAPPTQPAPSRRATSFNPRAVAGGRVSMDNPGDAWLGSSWIIDPPSDYEDEWRLGNFDANTLSKVSPDRLVEILSDLSPEVSRALWDFQLLCNPGYTAKAMRPGGTTEYPTAQKALDAFIQVLNDRHGTIDVLFSRMFMSPFWRGAIATELVLDESGRMPLNIVAVDPHCFRFKKIVDPVLGTVWQLGQWQGGQWVSLDIPTIRYVPIHPAIDSPYGRPMVSPALFTALFLLSMLHDLKRVVQQQGYPRLDISIDLEKLVGEFPEIESDPVKYQTWADDLVNMVTQVYSRLEPDDAYVHTSTVTVNRPVGAVDASSLGAVDALIKANERMATRALKTMPLMMGLDQSTNETDSNRQWEIFAAGTKSIQHYAETALSLQFSQALQCQGIQADVEFRFAELRAAEELRDEQTRTMRNNNAAFEYNQGWISQDEAAEKAVKHKPDQPAPRVSIGGTGQPQIVQDNGDGQEANKNTVGDDLEKRVVNTVIARLSEIMATEARVKITPDGADEPLLPVPDTVGISDTDMDRAIADWDRLMPDYAGLLNAIVVGQQHFDNAATVQARATGDSVWTWDQASKRYRSSTTGQFLGPKQMIALRDQFVEAKRDVATTLANDLGAGNSSIQEFEVAFRREVKTVFVDQYVLGKGGRNAMTQADFGAVGRMIRDQYSFAHDFAVAIAAGSLSQAQIANRAASYFSSSTSAFERGRSASYGMPTLPAYPADGSQQCRSNCRCSWGIVETDDAWECTWVTSPGESCATCLDNAERWAPLVIPKSQGRNRADVERILYGVAVNGHH